MNVHFFSLSQRTSMLIRYNESSLYLFRLITTQNGLNRIQVEISGSFETALYHREMSASRFKYSMIFSLLLHLNAYASKKETWTGYFFVFVTHSFIYEVFFYSKSIKSIMTSECETWIGTAHSTHSLSAFYMTDDKWTNSTQRTSTNTRQ